MALICVTRKATRMRTKEMFNKMEEDFEIKDESGDKKYFTIIPNLIANHSTANDQALYFQMKKHAGEKGECYASEKLLKAKLGIGSKALKKALTYLLSHKWITYTGEKSFMSNGGMQKRKTYIVNDIWKMNNDFYSKGVSERELLKDKGVSESNSRGVQKEAKGVSLEQQRRTIEEEPYNKIIKPNLLILGEFKNVKLSEEEHNKLIERFGKGSTDDLIEELAGYIASTNKKYASHYATILNWARRKTTERNYKKKNITII